MVNLEALKKISYTLGDLSCKECPLFDVCVLVMNSSLKDTEGATLLCNMLDSRYKRKAGGQCR